MKKKSNMLAMCILAICSCMFILCCSSNGTKGREDSISVEKTTEECPCSVLAFRQEIKGYQVEIDYHFEVNSEVGGEAVVKLSKQGRSYEAVCPDAHVIDSRLEELQSGDTLWTDYTAPRPDEYLSDESLVYFKDMDYDGEDELVRVYRSRFLDEKHPLRQTAFKVLFADKVGKREERIKNLDTDALIEEFQDKKSGNVALIRKEMHERYKENKGYDRSKIAASFSASTKGDQQWVRSQVRKERYGNSSNNNNKWS